MADRRQATPTRSELLGLRDERQLIREGYQFLDEKRIILAHEVLRQLSTYTDVRSRYRSLHAEAVAQLAAATARHGLEGLAVYPPRQALPGGPDHRIRRFLGLDILEFEGLAAEAPDRPDAPAFPSPEAERCAASFAQLTGLAAELALLYANLLRLIAEYRRTERRARALENVLLPEIDASIHFMEEQLEAIDQEEALRVRFAHPH